MTEGRALVDRLPPRDEVVFVTVRFVGLMPGKHDDDGKWGFPRCAHCECRASYVVRHEDVRRDTVDLWDACRSCANEVTGRA